MGKVNTLISILAGGFCFVLTGLLLVDAEMLEDKEFGFSLEIPDGFKPNPSLRQQRDIIHGYVLGDPESGSYEAMLLIERMRGRIPNERIDPKKLPPGFQGSVFTMKWENYLVDAIEVPEALNDTPTITFNVQIPLKKEAIQIKMFGAKERRKELLTLLEGVVSGLKGETNWVYQQPSYREGRAYGYVLLTIAIVAILLILVGMWVISRKAPRGSLLILALLLYAVGWLLKGIRVREVSLVSGVLQMAGFMGILLGIFDAIRKRRTGGSETPRGEMQNPRAKQ